VGEFTEAFSSEEIGFLGASNEGNTRRKAEALSSKAACGARGWAGKSELRARCQWKYKR